VSGYGQNERYLPLKMNSFENSQPNSPHLQTIRPLHPQHQLPGILNHYSEVSNSTRSTNTSPFGLQWSLVVYCLGLDVTLGVTLRPCNYIRAAPLFTQNRTNVFKIDTTTTYRITRYNLSELFHHTAQTSIVW